jgi:hypothetical protein
MRLNRISLAVLAGALLASTAAQAADNAIIITPGSGVTLRSKDIGGGVQSPIDILGDTSGNVIYGIAGTANVNVLTIQGVASMTPVGVSALANAFAVGSGTDGWFTTFGLKADTASATPGGTAMSVWRQIDADINTLNTTAGSALATQAPTVSIGGVGIVDSAGTNVATVKAASTAPAATDKQIVVGLNPTNAANTTPYIVNMASQYPAGAVPLNPVSGIGTTTGVAVTLTPVSGHTAFICGYSIRANATAAANVTNTMVGLGNTVTHQMWVAPLASGIGIDEQIFTPCRPASAVTTNIVVTPGNPGAGGNVTADAWGYSL